jgi:hypothetical protein
VSNNVIDGLSTPLSLHIGSTNLDQLKKYENEGNLNAKTALDFSFALQSCIDATKTPKYIALIESDVLFAEGWFAQALKALQQIESMTDKRRLQWSDLRLFRPESNTGWSDRAFLGNKVPQIILIVGLVLIAANLSLRNIKIPVGAKLGGRLVLLSNSNLIVLCVFIVPATVITFFATGKSSLVSLFKWSGFHTQNWGCCTQTIFFPLQNIPPLISEFLTRAGETSTDWMVMQHADRESLARYVLDPVLVQHRGAMESIITPERDSQATKGLLWSVSFEDLDPKRLKKEHLQAVQALFPKELNHQKDAG